MKIPFLSFKEANATIKPQILERFESFFNAEQYVLGDRVVEFEKNYATFNKVNHCVGISNGLDALHIALKTLGIGQGDEVIVPSNTYIASLLAVSYVGATPILVEPDINTYNIDPAKIEQAITAKTKAIMPVHLYGQACDMESIMQIAENHKLYVIEDNAQSQGAAFNGRLTGTWGNINATSFYPGKNLGALGDAGAVTTNDESLASKAVVLRNYGSAKKYFNEVMGYNMRIDECQASFLTVKLQYLPEWTKQRQQIAQWYREGLIDVKGIVLPYTTEHASHVYHLFVVRTPHRDQLQKHLTKNGIGSLIHYPVAPHLQEAYKHLGFQKGDFPIAEEIADTCLSLPMWPGMHKAMVDTVVEAIRTFS